MDTALWRGNRPITGKDKRAKQLQNTSSCELTRRCDIAMLLLVEGNDDCQLIFIILFAMMVWSFVLAMKARLKTRAAKAKSGPNSRNFTANASRDNWSILDG